MVQVGIVRVLVAHGLVPVPVRMQTGHRPAMGVLVVLVMGVAMLVLHRFVQVFVVMSLREMQP